MTPDERNILQPFLQDLAQSRGAAKDAEADALIAQTVRANPDAVYLLVQHAILSDQALQAAQAQIEDMQRAANAPAVQPPTFMSGGRPWPQPDPYAPAQGGPGPPPVQSNPLSSSGGLGGFLRSAGTMAAGVAGGEFLAQGLSNLFSPRDW